MSGCIPFTHPRLLPASACESINNPCSGVPWCLSNLALVFVVLQVHERPAEGVPHPPKGLNGQWGSATGRGMKTGRFP
jgi:hypothetical protein